MPEQIQTANKSTFKIYSAIMFIILLIIAVMIFNLSTTKKETIIDSNDLEQTTFAVTIDSNLPEHKNVIWCSTFQMAWDKFKDEFIKEPIIVIGAQDFADRLNRSQYKPENLEESSYYTAAGFVRKGIIKEIQTEMAKRFPEEPVPEFGEIYNLLEEPILAYSYLKVDIGFKYPFYTYKRDFFFESSNKEKTKVAAFCNLPAGTDPDFAKVIEQVDILYYEYDETKNTDYFAVDLCKYTQPYQVVLALIPECNTPDEALSNIENKISAFKNDKNYKELSKLRSSDTLIVPDVLYKLTHHYNEILGKDLGNQPWKDEGYFFFEAMQMIDFSLSKTGVVIKSEARLGAVSLSNGRIEEPRNMYFNRPFLIYAKKREAGSKPFFVMWIDNAELMKKL